MARREGADRGRRQETRVVDRPLIPVAGSPDWVWETDGEGRYVASSEGAERILGRPADSLLGRRVDEVFASVASWKSLSGRWRRRALSSGRSAFLG